MSLLRRLSVNKKVQGTPVLQILFGISILLLIFFRIVNFNFTENRYLFLFVTAHSDDTDHMANQKEDAEESKHI